MLCHCPLWGNDPAPAGFPSTFRATPGTRNFTLSNHLMKTTQVLRRVHLWLGCLFAPLLILFAVTGAIQTLGFNFWQAKKANLAELNAAERIVATLGYAHTARRFPYVENAEGQQEYRPWSWTKDDHRTFPYSAFVALMAVGLVATTALGIVMAYRFGGSARLVSLLLAVGILAPFLLYKLR